MLQRVEQAFKELQSKGLNPSLGSDHDYLAAQVAYQIERSCGSKRRFDAEKAAMIYILGYKRRTGRRKWYDTYECAHCNGWHIAKGVIP